MPNTAITFCSTPDTYKQLTDLTEIVPNTTKSKLCNASVKALLAIPPAALNQMRREGTLEAGLVKLVQAGCEALGYGA